jgi:hypothetical protein
MTEVMPLDSNASITSYLAETLRVACDASNESATCTAPRAGSRG